MTFMTCRRRAISEQTTTMSAAGDSMVTRTLNKRVRQHRTTHPARAFKGSHPWRSPHQYTGPRRQSSIDWPQPNTQQILLRYVLLHRIDDSKFQLDFQFLLNAPSPNRLLAVVYTEGGGGDLHRQLHRAAKCRGISVARCGRTAVSGRFCCRGILWSK